MSSRLRKISAGDVSSKWISFLDKEGVHMVRKTLKPQRWDGQVYAVMAGGMMLHNQNSRSSSSLGTHQSTNKTFKQILVLTLPYL